MLFFFVSVGGMNKQHRLSQGVGGAKKVTPPSIPNPLNPRGSGSSFGSDYSYERDAASLPEGAYSRDPSGGAGNNTTTDQRYIKVSSLLAYRGRNCAGEQME